MRSIKHTPMQLPVPTTRMKRLVTFIAATILLGLQPANYAYAKYVTTDSDIPETKHNIDWGNDFEMIHARPGDSITLRLWKASLQQQIVLVSIVPNDDSCRISRSRHGVFSSSFRVDVTAHSSHDCDLRFELKNRNGSLIREIILRLGQRLDSAMGLRVIE